MSLNSEQKSEFESWVTHSAGMGLTLEYAPTTYGGAVPESGKYETELRATLARAVKMYEEKKGAPIRYVEPWNEPNAQGGLKSSPETAAKYANAAYKICEEPQFKCTIIAGNFFDGPDMVEYEKEYEKYLKPVPVIWGMHPYTAVEKELPYKEETTVWKFQQNLPSKGAGDQIWFTEVGAFQCKKGIARGEIQQADDAWYLVDGLMPWFKPEHVFYYEFDFEKNAYPPCSETQADTALYVPNTAGEIPDVPRPAASLVFNNTSRPWAYTEKADSEEKRSARLRGTVYTGGFDETEYFYEYGPTTGYGMTAPVPAVNVGSGTGLHWAYTTVEGLTPYTTYHYRLVAKNWEATSYGADESVTTLAAPPSAASEPATEVYRTSAKLEGQVYPDSLPTEYYFEYNEAGGGALYTAKGSAGGDESWHWESATVSLKSCTKYQFQIMAANADPPSPVSGGVDEFTTECWPPSVKTKVASEVKSSSARLEGEVYPNGLEASYWFEYAKKGSTEWSKTPVAGAGSAKSWSVEHASVSGLASCTEYQLRVVAENEDSKALGSGDEGGVVRGEPAYFKTTCPPTIQNVKVSHLEPASVVLEAEVNPKAAETHYHFEYDTREYKQGEEAHGTSVPVPDASAGAGTAFVKVSSAVVKLRQGQTYYFNMVTTNESGRTTAASTFSTPVWWLLNGKTAPSSLSGSGVLVVDAPGLSGGDNQVSAKCTVSVSGKVPGLGSYQYGEITGLKGAKGEAVAPCTLVKSAGCEGTDGELEGVGLPWTVELEDVPVKNAAGEVERYEVRYRVLSSFSKGGAGWVLKCKYAGGFTYSVTCIGEVSGNVENVSSGVPVEFDALSPKMNCGTGKENGSQAGYVVFASTEVGKLLSVSGVSQGALPPVVESGAAKNVTSAAATLVGTVAAKGVPTKYWFEYGTTEAYGSKVPTSPVSAGEGRLPVEASQKIGSLEPSTLYHYRLVATNAGGTSYGVDKTVTPGDPAEWRLNGQATTASMSGSGVLVVEAPASGSGTISAKCAVSVSGKVPSLGSYQYGEITGLKGAKEEAVAPCTLIDNKGCEGTAAELEAVGLPWMVELEDVPVKNAAGEVERYEVRYRVLSFFSNPEAGWKLKCKEFGEFDYTATCAGEASGNVENVSSGVPVEFDALSRKMNCGTGKENGSQAGYMVFASTEEGKVLSVLGAPQGPLPPVVSTGIAKGVTGSEATLTGAITSKGSSTTYFFEYGTTEAYGSKAPASPVSAGEGRLPVGVSQKIRSLEPSTLYHYRLVATNGGGTSYGVDKTVTPGDPAEWRLGGEARFGLLSGSGVLVVEAPGSWGGDNYVSAECAVSMSGKVPGLGSYQYGEITGLKGDKGEAVAPCTLVKGAGCEGGGGELEGVGLPWTVELEDVPVKNAAGEVERYEVRYRVLSFFSKSGAGWVLKCKYAGGLTYSVTCVGEVSGNLENTGSGVPVEFDALSPRLDCGEGKGNGSQAGYVVLADTEEGKLLSVSGAPQGPVPPAVQSGSAENVTSTAATLAGTVAAKGVPTKYWFEYGTTIAYGSKLPMSPASIGEGRLAVEVSQQLSALQPRTRYHYRLVAESTVGTSYSADRTFSTATPAEWQVNGIGYDFARMKGTGTLILHDNGLEVGGECILTETGFGANEGGVIEKVTGTGGETPFACRTSQTGWCESATIETDGAYLGWSTGLVDVPIENQAGEVHYEVRMRYYDSIEPAWQIKCSFMGSTITDTCQGESSGTVENTTGGVNVDLEKQSPELTCTGSTIGTGTIEGTLTFTSTEEGKTLSVYGAPGP